MDSQVLDISSTIGLFALVTLCFNFLLGILLSTAYKRSASWKRLPLLIRRINLLDVHNWTAYLALALIITHPVLLLFDTSTKFLLPDILIPFRSSYQPYLVAMGILSFYAVIVVIITTQKKFKRKLGFRAWKNIHLVSYMTAFFMCFHGIFIDQHLKGLQTDYLDGEKLLCEICLLLLVLASIVRYRHYLKNGPVAIEN